MSKLAKAKTVRIKVNFVAPLWPTDSTVATYRLMVERTLAWLRPEHLRVERVYEQSARPGASSVVLRANLPQAALAHLRAMRAVKAAKKRKPWRGEKKMGKR